jgi:hypothetical protein
MYIHHWMANDVLFYKRKIWIPKLVSFTPWIAQDVQPPNLEGAKFSHLKGAKCSVPQAANFFPGLDGAKC